VFATTPQIRTDHLVSLADPKSDFAAENVVPLVYKPAMNPTITATLNAISAKLTTPILLQMDNAIITQHQDHSTVAVSNVKNNQAERSVVRPSAEGSTQFRADLAHPETRLVLWVPKPVSRALTCRSEAVGCSSGTLQAGRAVGAACARGFLSRFIAIRRPDGICQLQWATGWRA
jgi:Substrate binding domain of ABC-type glycine betaine transport system